MTTNCRFKKIASHFSLSRKSSLFLNVEESTKGDRQTFSEYQDYYLRERWREKLTQQAIAFINHHLDLSLLSHFGYSLLS